VLDRKSISGRLRGIEGLHVELVGRQVEMAALTKVVTDLKQGVGRIVCVLGEAGIGKSRLVSETRQIFEVQLGTEAYWFESTSLSFEMNQAYGLFQRLIRRVCGITHNDPEELIRTRMRGLSEHLGEQTSPEAMHLLEAMYGLPSENGGLLPEGDAFKQELLEAMRAWWRGQFASRPSVLVFEDMHWSDAASVDLLRQLLPLTEEMPLVLVCVMRNERQAPAWQIRNLADDEYRHRYTELALGPLSEAESNELVNRLLVNADLPDSLRLSIIEKAGGNPYFIEEVVRTLIDSGAVVRDIREVDGVQTSYWRATSDGVDFEIPDNLHSLLAARIDRLEEPTRATLQIASVIGRSFYRKVLQAVDEASQELDKHLGTLLRLEMIREAARMPELEYAFRNPMTQEAVYNTILLKRRREFHRRVGEVMEAIYSDRLEGLYGLLAYHFALSSQATKAIEYYRLAAQQAVAVYAYEDAIQNLQRALDLITTPEMGAIHLTLLEELGDIYRAVRDGEGAIERYQAALGLLSDPADGDLTEVRLQTKIVQVVTEVKWSVGLDYLHRVTAARQAARARLEGSLHLLESQAPQLETVRVLNTLSMDAWRIEDPPDWETAQDYAQRAVTLARQVDSPGDLSRALGALATVLDGRSRLREHLHVSEERLEICRQPGFDDLTEVIDAVHSHGAALMYVGEYERAIPLIEEAESLARNAQLFFQQTGSLGLLAQCLFRLDRWDEVLAIEDKWRDLEGRYTRERVGGT
jgi:tetratricopeptide (TPR) repeat protein